MPRNDLKAYTSVIARIPQDLAEQVKRYAREHRCAVSELIRDGLEMRLEAESPWQAPGDSRNPDGEVLHEVLHALEALTPMLRAQLQDTVRATIAEVLHEVIPRETSKRTAAREVIHEVLPTTAEVVPGHTSTPQAQTASRSGGMTKVIPGNTLVIPARSTGRTARRGITEVIPQLAPSVQSSRYGITEVLPFDPVKYRLGKLCPQGHDYQGTGQSLRVHNKAGYCIACNVAIKQRKREQARQQGVRV